MCSAATLAARPAGPAASFFPVVPLWTLALNNATAAPPVYSGGEGFFSIEGGRLAAYDLATGKQLWLIASTPQSRPAVSDTLVFVAEPAAIRAIRQTDGSEAWNIPFADSLAAPLVWDNGWLVATNATGRVVAFRAADGREIWRRELGVDVHTPPALAADRVYVAPEDGRVVSLLVATGEIAWDRRLGGAATSLLALDDRIFAGSADNFFYAIGAKHGEIIWRWRTGGDIVGLPALDDDRVYFVSLDNVLRALNRRTGAQLWKRALPARPTSGPVLAGTSVLVTALDPALHVFAAKDGKPGTDLKVDGAISPPAAVVDAPSMPAPLLLYVTTDVTNVSSVIAMTRSLEPANLGPVAPLPNPIKP